MILLAQNRQADRDRDEIQRDRDMNARSLADTEFLAREMAAIRLALEQKTDRQDLIDAVGKLTEAIERLDRTYTREAKQTPASPSGPGADG